MKYLIVVDMQNDFISGSLGSGLARSIVPNVKKLIESFDGTVIFTADTHGENYLRTQEGKRLPVVHCVKGTRGHSVCDELKTYAETIVEKPTFGSFELIEEIKRRRARVEEITLCGLCTDICVISNAMILKAAFPETRISVVSSCCAGVTPKSHETALDAMRAVQIDVID